jgi:hypothetical protein
MYPTNDKMKIILLATHTNPYFDNTFLSLTTSKIFPIILGQGEQWKGWKWRLEKYLDFCNELISQNVSKNELCIFLDAFDILCLRNDTVESFEKMFNNFNSDIVFSSEWWCMNKNNCGTTKRFKLKDEEMCFLKNKSIERKNYGDSIWTSTTITNFNVNAGFVCGKLYALQKMYSDILQEQEMSILAFNTFDDQKEISLWIDSEKSKTLKLNLDIEGILCKTVNVFDVSINETGKVPFFLHFPGPMLKIGLFPHYQETISKMKLLNSKTVNLFPLLVTIVYILVTIFIISTD